MKKKSNEKQDKQVSKKQRKTGLIIKETYTPEHSIKQFTTLRWLSGPVSQEDLRKSLGFTKKEYLDYLQKILKENPALRRWIKNLAKSRIARTKLRRKATGA